MALLIWLLIIAGLGYALLLLLMYLFQRSLTYFPDRTRTAPAQAGLPQAQELKLTSDDGETVIAWAVAPRDGSPVVLYFHGNGGALKLRVARFRKLVADGNGLLALSYRGYGGSSGKPSEAGLIRDAHAAYDEASARWPARKLVVWGESLGTAVAIALAAERRLDGVILDAPFTSAADVGAAAYPFAPVHWLMRDRFHSDRRIARVRTPILVLHGERDRIVPIVYGERLFALAHEPKRFVRFRRAGHINLDDHGAIDVVRQFLAGLKN